MLAAVSLPAIEHFLDKLAKPNQCRYNNKDEATTTSVLRRFYLQTKLRREAVKKTSTAKQVLGNCERMVLAKFIGNRVFILNNIMSEE